MAKIAFFEVEKWESPPLKKAFKGHKLQLFTEPLTKSRVKKVKDIDTLGVFIYSNVTEELLKQMPKLKLINTMSTGYDHIDIKACKKRKIALTNVPFYGENTVAEHTFALLLGVSRKIPQSIERCKEGVFSPKGLRGFDLKGKTLGILGLGHIGEHMARMAKAFEMDVIATSRKKKPKLCKKLGCTQVSFKQLLKRSDIISLHLPLNDKTKHTLNDAAFRQMKKGVVILNTARGALIDTKALLTALKNKTVAGAGLDVLEEECSIKEEKQLLSRQFRKSCDVDIVLADHILIQREDVLVTPHNAFNSKEALVRILNTSIDNIKGFLKNKKVNRVKV